MPKMREIPNGERSGRLVVTGGRFRDDRGTHRIPVRCDCGTEKTIAVWSLGKTLSCGCILSEIALRNAAMGTTHGRTNSTEYNIWVGIKQRCFNENHTAWARYGGRGITMCDQWRNSFETFLADVGERPSKNHTIDRIDNDGNYEPGNVRWATGVEQQANRTTSLSPTCKRGHARTPENIRVNRDGSKACRPCEHDRYLAKRTSPIEGSS